MTSWCFKERKNEKERGKNQRERVCRCVGIRPESSWAHFCAAVSQLNDVQLHYIYKKNTQIESKFSLHASQGNMECVLKTGDFSFVSIHAFWNHYANLDTKAEDGMKTTLFLAGLNMGKKMA